MDYIKIKSEKKIKGLRKYQSSYEKRTRYERNGTSVEEEIYEYIIPKEVEKEVQKYLCD